MPDFEVFKRLEQALDLSKNVLDQAKRDLGNSPKRSSHGQKFNKNSDGVLFACLASRRTLQDKSLDRPGWPMVNTYKCCHYHPSVVLLHMVGGE